MVTKTNLSQYNAILSLICKQDLWRPTMCATAKRSAVLHIQTELRDLTSEIFLLLGSSSICSRSWWNFFDQNFTSLSGPSFLFTAIIICSRIFLELFLSLVTNSILYCDVSISQNSLSYWKMLHRIQIYQNIRFVTEKHCHYLVLSSDACQLFLSGVDR